MIATVVPALIVVIAGFMILEQLQDAPGVEVDGELSSDEEQTLYKHYDLDFGDYEYTDEDANGTVGHDTSGPSTDER